MKKRLIIHIGYPKTATTSLQFNLFGDLMRDGKIEYLNHLNRKEDYLGSTEVKNIVKYITSNISSSSVKRELDILKKMPSKDYLISSENISFFYEDFKWGYHSDKSFENFFRIKELLFDIFDEIQFLVGIRAQISLIPSFYRQQYNYIINENPSFKDFNYWLNETIFNKDIGESVFFLNYKKIYSQLSELFGKDNVHFLIFEDLSKNPNEYYSQLSKIFNVETQYIQDSLSRKKANVGNTKDGNYISSRPTIKQKYIGPLKYLLKKHLPVILFNFWAKWFNKLLPSRFLNKKTGESVVIQNLSECQFEEINNFYKASNIEFMNVAGLTNEKFVKYYYI